MQMSKAAHRRSQFAHISTNEAIAGVQKVYGQLDGPDSSQVLGDELSTAFAVKVAPQRSFGSVQAL